MIIDSHTHIIGDVGVPVLDMTLETTLSHMEKVGCDLLIQSSGEGITSPTKIDTYAQNAIELYEKSGARILTSFIFDPNKIEACTKMIEENAAHPAFVGIKIHPSDHSVDGSDERYRPAWELAKKYNFPILSHTWALTSNPKQVYSVPEKFEKFLSEYPAVSFIFGHSGGRVRGIRKAMEIGKKYKNAYFDIAGDILDFGLIEYLCENVGADRVLFGSDVGWFDPTVQIGMVLGAAISTEDKKKILGENAARIYKIGG